MIERLINKVPNYLLNFIGLLSGSLTIISALFRYLIMPFLDANENNALSVTSFRLISIVLRISGAVYIIWSVWKIVRYRKVQQKTRGAFSNDYYTVLHDYRNLLGEISVIQNDMSDTEKLIEEKIGTFTIGTLEKLCNIFEVLTNQEVSGCIKLIAPNSEAGALRKEDACVFTYKRVGNTKDNRSAYDENYKIYPIKKNTDFKVIVMDHLPFFYQENLLKYAEMLRKTGQKYENSNEDWMQYYRSTIVVPIRIANKRNAQVIQNDEYTIVGFLCVDSMSTLAFEDGQRKYYVDIMKSFAAILYVVFNLYRRCIENKKM